MKKLILLLFFFYISTNVTKACHGVALVNYAFTVNANNLTINGGSGSATCGCGPYWMQVELSCTAAGLNGLPPAAVQNQLATWTGPGTTLLQHPWYFSLLNLPNYTQAGGWPDQCVDEAYVPIVIPFTNLCPGQTYFFRAREWVGGSNSPGPWTAMNQFTVPGTLTPLNFNISGNPLTYCAPGSSTLSMTGLAGGGCGSITYTWQPGGVSTANYVVSPNTTTTYTLTAEAPCQNPVSQSITVNVVNGLSAAFTSNVNICQGNPEVFTHTGTAGAAHNWAASPGAGVTIATATSTNPSITFGNAGNYVVTHTVTVGSCTASATSNVSVTAVASTFAIPSATQCLNGNSFNFNNTGTAGGTHSYSFSPAAGAPAVGNTANYSGSFTAPGTYIVTHSVNSNGCTSVTNQTVVVNAHPTATSVIGIPCNGSSTGSFTVTGTGGSGGAFTYTLTNPVQSNTTGQFTNLAAGNYTVDFADGAGCSASTSVTITQPSAVTLTAVSAPAICNGTATGTINLTGSGGTPTYSYNLNGGAYQPGSSFTAIAAGSYTMGITDINNCTQTQTVQVTEPTALSITLSSQNADCIDANGIASATVSGGTSGYTYTWSPAGGNNSATTGVVAGTYTVNATDNNGCPVSGSVTVNSTPGGTAAITSFSNISCNGIADGSITATMTGGAPTFTYSWSSTPAQNTATAVNLGPGSYTCTITDIHGCVATASGNLTEPTALTATITANNALCFGASSGTVSAGGIGGTPPYTYSWTPTGSSLQTVPNVPAGIYTCTVTDDHNCSITQTVTVSEPTIISITSSVTPAVCNQANGSATVTATGGTPGGYTYTWTPGNITGATISNQFAGIYTVTAADVNNCIQTLTVNIPNNSTPSLTITGQTNVSCFGGNNGTINTTVSGGAPSYTYTWSNGQGSASVTGLLAGVHTVTVTDNDGCTDTETVTITEPSQLTSSYTSSPETCSLVNGSATVTVNGGTPNTSAPTYTMIWNTTPVQQGSVAVNTGAGNSWACTITDLNGCSITQTVAIASAPGPVITATNMTQPSCFGMQDGSVEMNFVSGTPNYSVSWAGPSTGTIVTTSLTHTVNGVGAGNYTLTVTDNYGCTSSQLITVTQPTGLMLNVGADPTICFGQSAQISANAQNGTPTYTYNWTPSTLVGGGTHTVTPTTTTSYTVVVADANGCITAPKIITVNVTPQLTISAYTISACMNNTVMLAPTITSPGNGGPYMYTWLPGNAATPTLIATANNTNTPVHYTLTVSDGCTVPSAVAEFTLITNPLPVISFTASPLAGCVPLNTTITASSNGPNDLFSWQDNTNPNLGTGNQITHTYADSGRYTISLHVVNPATGCMNDLVKTNYITAYGEPVAAFIPDPPSASLVNPTINFLNTSIGASNYSWNFGDPAATGSANANTSIIRNPSHTYGYTGTYNVYLVVTSPHGCIDTVMHTVEITPDYVLYIPNAFTPDENGVNDVFLPLGIGIGEGGYKMEVFDRWGALIFESDDIRKGWDGSVKGGKPAPQDVYVYKIQVVDMMGAKHPYVGHITVTRVSQ